MSVVWCWTGSVQWGFRAFPLHYQSSESEWSKGYCRAKQWAQKLALKLQKAQTSFIFRWQISQNVPHFSAHTQRLLSIEAFFNVMLCHSCTAVIFVFFSLVWVLFAFCLIFNTETNDQLESKMRKTVKKNNPLCCSAETKQRKTHHPNIFWLALYHKGQQSGWWQHHLSTL